MELLFIPELLNYFLIWFYIQLTFRLQLQISNPATALQLITTIKDCQFKCFVANICCILWLFAFCWQCGTQVMLDYTGNHINLE